MRIVKPRAIISGFHAESPDAEVPELRFLGEQWAPEDYEIARHSHEVWELYLQVHGWSVWEDEAGREYRCAAGSLLAPPPGREHWLKKASEGRHHFLFAAIDVDSLVRDRLPDLAPAWRSREVIFVPEARACESDFRRLVREVTAARPFRARALRNALESLVIELTRLRAASSGSGRAVHVRHPAVEAACQAMETHPAEPWTLAGLGELASISPNHLATLFRQETGESPHRYLLKVRLDRAKELLATTDASVTEIAHELGFHSSQHFARFFRQWDGGTPTAFRTRAGIGSS